MKTSHIGHETFLLTMHEILYYHTCHIDLVCFQLEGTVRVNIVVCCAVVLSEDYMENGEAL